MTKYFDFKNIKEENKKESRIIDINFFTYNYCHKFLEENPKYNTVIVTEDGKEKHTIKREGMKAVWNKEKGE